ncbi:bifunctional diguanylate cyclase/phosphodiesterase [Chitinimonas taiwanensis]|uniref:bifunctional diguanylate cyclase/phosphodiesterase n=1 Tax=Chitinimonas taiwanensis TaxID=240412 RepID=UPI0035AFCFC5
MSLLRQLWLVVVISTLMAFVGGFVVNLSTARQYLEQQLLTQSSDNAASLALSMSQQSKDAATVELMVSALFDSGHFRLVRFEDVNGKLVTERRSHEQADEVPAWFTRLVPLHVQAGTGMVSDGWKQAGRVTVIAHERFAYHSLWHGALTFLAVIALTGLLSGIAVTALIRWVRRPLSELVAQAAAIGERHFVTIREPNVSELRLVVRTMNAMVDRVKAMFNEQAARIDELRTHANRDALTGLPNRDNFMGRLRQAMVDEMAAPRGALLLIRLHDLNGVNRSLGRLGTDDYLRRVAQALSGIAEEDGERLLARLNGADFALLAPSLGRARAEALAKQCLLALESLTLEGFSEHNNLAHIGVGFYQRGSQERNLLSAADQALAQAENLGSNAVVLDRDADDDASTVAEWRQTLEQALAAQRFELACFPVLQRSGELLHQEAVLRLRGRDGTLQTAGQFMPMAARLGLLPQLDLVAVALACQQIAKQPKPMAVNLSSASIADAGFLTQLQALLSQHADAAAQLWLEVNEYGLHGDYERLSRLCALAHRFGVKVGIEHFGRQFGRIPALYDLRLDYLKVDGSFVRDIHTHSGNQQLVKAIVGVAAGAGLQVIAEAVHQAEEWTTLHALGVDGMTGPLATEQFQG